MVAEKPKKKAPPMPGGHSGMGEMDFRSLLRLTRVSQEPRFRARLFLFPRAEPR
jgi:hypothetical protein